MYAILALIISVAIVCAVFAVGFILVDLMGLWGLLFMFLAFVLWVGVYSAIKENQ